MQGTTDPSRRACYLSEYGKWMEADFSACRSLSLAALLASTLASLLGLLPGQLTGQLLSVVQLLAGTAGTADIDATATLLALATANPASLTASALLDAAGSVAAIAASLEGVLAAVEPSAASGPQWPLLADRLADMALGLVAARPPADIVPGWPDLFSLTSSYLYLAAFAARSATLAPFNWSSVTRAAAIGSASLQLPAANLGACVPACSVAVGLYPHSAVFLPGQPSTSSVLSVRLNNTRNTTLATPIEFTLELSCQGACREYIRGLISRMAGYPVAAIDGNTAIATRSNNQTHLFAVYQLANASLANVTNSSALAVVAVPPSCTWWNFSARNWSSSGCAVVRVADGAVTCRCWHLTNFAILMNPRNSDGDGRSGSNGDGSNGGSSNGSSSSNSTYSAASETEAELALSLLSTVGCEFLPCVSISCSVCRGPCRAVRACCALLIQAADSHVLSIKSSLPKNVHETAVAVSSRYRCVLSMAGLVALLLVLLLLRREKFMTVHHFVLAQLAVALFW